VPCFYIVWEDHVAHSITVVILAADGETLMDSKLPKALHPVAGQPMIEYALQNAEALKPEKIYVVLGAHSESVAEYIGRRAVPVAQKRTSGTGRAIQQVVSLFKPRQGDVVIINADACLTSHQTVQALRQFHLVQGGAAALLSARVQDPFGCGRVIRGEDGTVETIVEEKDASEEERAVNEVNAGLYIFKTARLMEALKKLKTRPSKKEYDLTDAVHYLLAQGGKVHALMVPDASEILHVNDREQLARAHRVLNLRRVEEYQRDGVTFLNPQTVEIDPGVLIGKDTVIESSVQLLGETILGEGCRIESGSRLQSAGLGKGVVIRSSRVTESRLGDGCDAGPFAHVRGGSRLDKNVHVGTNTELKNARIASGSKVGHFSYVGDADLGRNVNVGAGCVFANFDGKNKHDSKIGDNVFLGSNSTLVSPVVIGRGAVVGAGSVVTKNVAPGATVAGVPARTFPKKKKS